MWSIHLFVFSKFSKKVLFLFFVVVLLFLFPNHQLSSQETTNGLCIYELAAFCFKDSMYKRSSFQVWLVSLSIMHSRSSHIVRNGQNFTFYGWINTLVSVCVCVCLCLCITISLSNYPLIDTGYFHVLAIVNNTAINTNFSN